MMDKKGKRRRNESEHTMWMRNPQSLYKTIRQEKLRWM